MASLAASLPAGSCVAVWPWGSKKSKQLALSLLSLLFVDHECQSQAHSCLLSTLPQPPRSALDSPGHLVSGYGLILVWGWASWSGFIEISLILYFKDRVS